ncbi:MAG: FkbM family methyltransferase [Sulfitobacter sp.]
MFSKLRKFFYKRWRILTDASYREFRAEIKRFFNERGRGTPSEYDGLTPESVVFDLGGYRGDWAANMRTKYDCFVHVFEPHPEFADHISKRFANDAKVFVHACALGATEGTLMLSDAADGSSVFSKGAPNIKGRVCNATRKIATLKCDDIAATKINIEGGEYDILPHLIETGAISKFKTITVQFHDFAPNAAEARAKIRADLSKTHRCSWNYEFVWEEWVHIESR